jgi:hypothetical protein
MGSRWSSRIWRAAPRWIWILGAVVLLAGTVRFCVATRADGKSPEIKIGTDARYHWAFLTSIWLDGDLDFTNQYANPESGNYYEYGKTPTGRLANPFPIGPAVMWTPFFAVAHLTAQVVGPEHADDGTSMLHQRITLYGSLVYAFLAMVLTYALVRRRYPHGPAALAALAALLCGPILQYVINAPGYAHAPSACCVAALWWAWDRGRGQPRSRLAWVGLGALIGLAMMVRAQNLVFALPVVGEAVIVLLRAWRASPRQALTAAAGPALGALVALVVFSPQMLAWHTLYGHWLGVPQGEGYMRWSEPLWAETLFSSRNGLFPYAPVWALGMLGLCVAAWRKDRPLVIWLLVTFAITAYLNGASSDWSGGGSFGGRRYDGMLVPVALGLAAAADGLLRVIERRPRLAGGVALLLVLAVFGTCNVMMTEDYRRGRLPPSASKDTLALYDRVAMRAARSLWQAVGNPLSWPGAWMFAWRTGAPVSSYDAVVGTFVLTDFSVEQYRKRSDKKTDELRFADDARAPFLVRGFGAVREEAGVTQKVRVAGAEARVLVPINHAGGATLELVGHGAGTATTVRVLWNDREVARGAVPAQGKFSVPFTLGAEQIERGINLVDLVLEPAGQVAYQTLRLRETP